MINPGTIYKYTNLVNGKIYIGQTITTIECRDKKHLSQLNDNTYFHKALKKYGRENFSLEIVEDNISIEKLDDKEKYYIDVFDSFYTTGKGYNLTQGGKWGSGTQKLTISQAIEIQNLILTSSLLLKEIAKIYDTTIYAVSDINRGVSFHNHALKYPLRESPKKSELNQDKVDIIFDMLTNSQMTQKEIALATDVNVYTVGQLNQGKNSWCPNDINYPIRKPIQQSTYQNVLHKSDVVEICYKLCFSSMSFKEIGAEYNVASNTISDISRGISWKEITSKFVCPIKKNKLVNQEIYQSIYGIV